MKLNRNLLNEAVENGLISEQQVDPLWEFMSERTRELPSFHATHVLYYLGGLTGIGAMTLFMTLGWERFGGWGLLFISLAYAAGGIWLTEMLLKRKGLPIPAGIAATFVVALTPLAIYAFQVAMGWWPQEGGYQYRDYHTFIDWRWMNMEFATLASGLLMLWRYRLPFLVLPVAFTLWYMSMDLAPSLFQNEDLTWELQKIVSLWFGLLMVLLAFWVDIRTRSEKDYAFWLYLFGVLSFWGALLMMDSDSELNKFIYLCINLSMIAVGTMLSRRVFAVFGGLGTAGYLGYLAYDLFEDSMIFPFALTLIGFGIVYIGTLWQRNEVLIQNKLLEFVKRSIENRG